MAAWRPRLAIALIAVACAIPRSSFFQTVSPRSLTVFGTGTVEVRANVLEAIVPVVVGVPLSTTSMKSFRESRKTAVEMIEACKIDGLSIRGSGAVISATGISGMVDGLGFANAAMVRATRGRPQLSYIQELLTVRVKDIDRLDEDHALELSAKLADALKPALFNPSYSLQIGFRLDPADRGHEPALAKAIEEANAGAKRMARLLGAKIGKPLHVEEQQPDPDSAEMRIAARLRRMPSPNANFTVTKTVKIDFELVD